MAGISIGGIALSAVAVAVVIMMFQLPRRADAHDFIDIFTFDPRICKRDPAACAVVETTLENLRANYRREAMRGNEEGTKQALTGYAQALVSASRFNYLPDAYRDDFENLRVHGGNPDEFFAGLTPARD